MAAAAEGSGFQVDLEAFSGPLDLLLGLIRREELDILDIPIARITDQYLLALDEMRERRVEVSGEFMVMAATLMQLKSRMLLPRPAAASAEEEEEDPRRELVELLLEYQRYKEAADLLSSLAEVRQKLFDAPGEPLVGVAPAVAEVTLTALFQAYERVLAEAVIPPPPPLGQQRWNVAEQAAWLLQRLVTGPCSFRELFGPEPRRLEVVVTFMAVLELVRDGLLVAEQNTACGEIELARRDDDHD
ncbi:MAG: segregation/condensation protein A [Armatimonadetes bacterium]|nr:segregation/condensation protein A [Armatimonadota bacterium]